MEITTPNLVQQAPEWTLYPNPATTHINIELETAQEAQIAIKDMNGRLVYSAQSQDQTTTLDVSNYAAGTYIVKITLGEQVTAKKFILKK